MFSHIIKFLTLHGNMYKRARYKCDPNKNIKCKKRECFINGGECRLTRNIKYQEDGEIIYG